MDNPLCRTLLGSKLNFGFGGDTDLVVAMGVVMLLLLPLLLFLLSQKCFLAAKITVPLRHRHSTWRFRGSFYVGNNSDR